MRGRGKSEGREVGDEIGYGCLDLRRSRRGCHLDYRMWLERLPGKRLADGRRVGSRARSAVDNVIEESDATTSEQSEMSHLL